MTGDEVGEAQESVDQATEATGLKKSRTVAKLKFTRTVERVREGIESKSLSKRRALRELKEARRDFDMACEINGELYLIDEVGQRPLLNAWEKELLSMFYDLEETVELYVGDLDKESKAGISEVGDKNVDKSDAVPVDKSDAVSVDKSDAVPVDKSDTVPDDKSDVVPVVDKSDAVPERLPETLFEQSFDHWIDDLIEFQENKPKIDSEMSISEALCRIEMNRDIPVAKLPSFNGDPLNYIEFIERFKTQVHDKNLDNNAKMIQLISHLTGHASKALQGFGCQGVMYVTALKSLKEQFGTPSAIVRAYVNKLTSVNKISAHDKQGLREYSLNILTSLAAFSQLKFCSDANSNEILRSIVSKLPDNLIYSWKSKVVELRDLNVQPSLHHISEMVRKRVKADFDPDFGDLRGESKFVKPVPKKGVSSVEHSRKVLKCYICGEAHIASKCPTLENMTVEQRIDKVKEAKLCFSCLNKFHSFKTCRYKQSCPKDGCSKEHHVLLHSDAKGVATVLDQEGIMPIVRVKFISPEGHIREGNVLVDSGAGTTIIRREFAQKLGLQGRKENVNLSLVGGKSVDETPSRRLKFCISHVKEKGPKFKIEAHELDHTTLDVPSLDTKWLKSFSHLSDIELYHKAGPVDLILGVQYSHLHAEDEIRKGKEFEPVGKHTALGWFVIGPINKKYCSPVQSLSVVQSVNMEKFYALETLGVQAPDCQCPPSALSENDRETLEMFKTSCTFDSVENRYQIGLPWKCDPKSLPDNYPAAERRLESLERSLKRNEKKAGLYSSVMKQYEDNGWSQRVPQEELDNWEGPVFYLPHHGVYRPEKSSTPLRVVFDPAFVCNGVSLNSFLHKGPGLIGDLLGVLLRFREGRVAFTGDISKMYLQIKLPPEDTHLHRYLWRDLDDSKPPDIFKLTRVTFGDKSSPDMACFVILHLADTYEEEFPLAADILRNDRYMDDLIHSCASNVEADKKMQQLDDILEKGSFKIKEWICTSNDTKVDTDTSGEVQLHHDGESLTKTLGVSWNHVADTLGFTVKLKKYDGELTKRKVLSIIAQIYDPLGLAAAVTIRPKIALQDIWREKHLKWDDVLPDQLQQIWQRLFREMESLKEIVIPRCLKPADASGDPELHVFCDASQRAYGAVAYLMWPTSDVPEVCIVSAKGRVAPLKQSTIPRLELMGAIIGARLAKTIMREFTENPSVTLWTDSRVVLHWLKSESSTLNAFVGIRVAEIQSVWGYEHWRFVPTELNVADDLSRGILAEDCHGRWIHGPAFLKQPKEGWPKMCDDSLVENPEMKKKIKTISCVSSTCKIVDPVRFSKWGKLVRVTAYCAKFIKILKSRIRNGAKDVEPQLTPEDLFEAETSWISLIQSEVADWKPRYKDLHPFEDKGLIRVGGRVKHSSLSYDMKHPLLIPSGNHIAKLIMRDIHENIGHAGPERTLYESRNKYWIVKGRNLAKNIVRDCVTCKKMKQPAHSTLMADLPAERLATFSPPFTTTGIDVFGPLNMKISRNKCAKVWGVIFTCATTRGIHLEVLEDLSTQCFMQSLRRFVAHHGWPTTIITDNGKNFVGAEREIRKLYNEGKTLKEEVLLHKVNWKFNTPFSPHQGGFYESLIKTVKRVLKTIIGKQTLTFGEMATVFCEIKGIVNGRPLGYVHDDTDSPQPLTPNHFIIGRSSIDVPQGPFHETKNLNKRFEYVQMLVSKFWNRFIREYIPTLQRRAKWQDMKRQLQVGDIVLLVDFNAPRGKWDLAKIEQVFEGNDGVIRNVQVKTSHGVFKRSVQKCCLIVENSG